MQRWGEKRYHSLDYHLKQTYGEKLYKLALNGGMTCPNRDGTLGDRGCIFCSAGGSGDFAGNPRESICQQIKAGKELIRKKTDAASFIAYFQAYTNTYAEVSYLEKIFSEAISCPEIKILSIATRPDCLDDKILTLLARLNRIKPVWVELGLQTIHEQSARFIRRGYPLSVFETAVSNLRQIGVEVIVHTILYLPGETESMMQETLSHLNALDIQGIKLQLLHILNGTDLADYYEASPFFVPTMEEYITFLGTCISQLRPDLVIHRLTGDGPKDLLIAPLWTGHKRLVLNTLNQSLKKQDLWQGKNYKL